MPKKVLVLGSYAPSLVNFRGPLLEAIAAAGHELVACAPPEPGWSPREVERLGARFVPVPLSRTGLNPIRDARTFRSLKRLFAEERPDVFLGYTAKPVIYGVLAARAAGVPASFALVTGLGYAFTAGTELRRRALRHLTMRLYRAALARTSLVFFQNSDDIQDFRRLGILSPGVRTQRLSGSGVDLRRFPSSPVPEGPTTFLLIARLVRDKGISEYAEAARLLKPAWPEARFVLVGPFDGNPAALSPDEVAAWQQEGLIDYAGEQKDVRPFLRDCTVYVLPSYREGMPRTVLEAMATGRAVITTDAPGCRETVEPGGNGLLVPVRATSVPSPKQCAASSKTLLRRWRWAPPAAPWRRSGSML